MIKHYSLKMLEKAINHTLALDESMPTKLAALQGKVLEIIISPLDVHFFIRFEQQQVHLLTDYNGHANTIIHSSPLGLIRLSILPASKARSLFNDRIKMSGDVEFGQQVKQLFDELDLDWEGHLAYFTGDVIAYQLGSFYRQGIGFKKQLSQSFQYYFSEYLQEELAVLPPNEAVEDFFNDIDQLALDVERLDAKLNLLITTHETP